MIVDNGGYYWLEVFFIASLYGGSFPFIFFCDIFMYFFVLVSLLATVAIMLSDICGTGLLNMSPAQRDEFNRST